MILRLPIHNILVHKYNFLFKLSKILIFTRLNFNIKIYFSFLVFIVFNTSCFNKKITSPQQENKLEICLTSNGTDYKGDSINLFSILVHVEEILIKENLISKQNSKSYLIFYKKVIRNQIDVKDILSKIEHKEPNAYMITIPTNFLTVVNCFKEAAGNSSKKGNLIRKESNMLTHIFKTGNMSARQFKKILNITNATFEKDIYRLPLLAIIYSQIEIKVVTSSLKHTTKK